MALLEGLDAREQRLQQLLRWRYGATRERVNEKSWYVIEEACQKHACRQGCAALTAPHTSRFEEQPLRSAALLRLTHVGALGLQDPRLSPPDPV
jgi:hypothetical protein